MKKLLLILVIPLLLGASCSLFKDNSKENTSEEKPNLVVEKEEESSNTDSYKPPIPNNKYEHGSIEVYYLYKDGDKLGYNLFIKKDGKEKLIADDILFDAPGGGVPEFYQTSSSGVVLLKAGSADMGGFTRQYYYIDLSSENVLKITETPGALEVDDNKITLGIEERCPAREGYGEYEGGVDYLKHILVNDIVNYSYPSYVQLYCVDPGGLGDIYSNQPYIKFSRANDSMSRVYFEILEREYYFDLDSSEVELGDVGGVVLKELPEEYRFNDKTEEITLDQDYMLVNSLLSNDGKKLAYAEMFRHVYHKQLCEDKCPLRYNIKVKDLETGSVETLYENVSEEVSLNIWKKIIPTAHAGSNKGWGIYLPVRWTSDDSRLVIKDIGGTFLIASHLYWSFSSYYSYDGYKYVAIDMQTNKMYDLASPYATFIDNGDSVVYLESTKKYYPTDPPGPGEHNVYGRVIFKDIDDNEEIVLEETEEINYRVKEITSDRKLILEGRETTEYEHIDENTEFLEILEIDLP